MTAAIVACHTDGCTEQDVAKDAELPEPGFPVICGQCGQQIADVVVSS